VPALFHFWYANAYWGSPFSIAQKVPREDFNGHFWEGLAGILVSPSRGLFVFSPIFLFAIPAGCRLSAGSFGPRSASPLSRHRHCCHAASLLALVDLVGRAQFRLPAACAAPDAPRRYRLAEDLEEISPSGLKEDIDVQQDRLWKIRNSELEFSTRKLIRTALPNSTSAALAEPPTGRLPPAGLVARRTERRLDSRLDRRAD